MQFWHVWRNVFSNEEANEGEKKKTLCIRMLIINSKSSILSVDNILDDRKNFEF